MAGEVFTTLLVIADSRLALSTARPNGDGSLLVLMSGGVVDRWSGSKIKVQTVQNGVKVSKGVSVLSE